MVVVVKGPSNTLVYLRDGSAQTIVRAANTEIEVADTNFVPDWCRGGKGGRLNKAVWQEERKLISAVKLKEEESNNAVGRAEGTLWDEPRECCGTSRGNAVGRARGNAVGRAEGTLWDEPRECCGTSRGECCGTSRGNAVGRAEGMLWDEPRECCGTSRGELNNAVGRAEGMLWDEPRGVE